ncbi:hypothetical protein FFI97_023290 [Variovorax sp. KBS0712]|uniref:hypothetical protein n=1 Tax=Variovorax sp. KBS0712 TaxID=2578111 RepID=UPI00111AD266|nr:hypothetical protein [Variovorax sp. KBS0712]TSD57074.1 hypothetical protein FFI97_023290 [Variovorax sp. KBS0712]
MSLDLDWTSIRPLGGSKHASFEELCTQLARAGRPAGSTFHRKGRPDSGVEAYAVLPDSTELAWQSKYFHTLGDSQWSQLDESVRAALDGHPKLTCYIACVPLDLPDGRSGRGKSAQQRWTDRVVTWTRWASDKGMEVEFVWQGSHELLAELAKPENDGLAKFFFDTRYLDDAWFRARLVEAHESAGPRYTAELNVKLSIGEQFEAFGRTSAFFDRIRSVASSIREQVRSHAFSVAKGPNAVLDPLIAAARLACDQALDKFKTLSDDPTVESPLAAIQTSLGEAVEATQQVLLEHPRSSNVPPHGGCFSEQHRLARSRGSEGGGSSSPASTEEDEKRKGHRDADNCGHDPGSPTERQLPRPGASQVRHGRSRCLVEHGAPCPLGEWERRRSTGSMEQPPVAPQRS